MIRDLTRGIIRENPVFVSLLGLCPSLAITTRVDNALGLGAAALAVIVLSSLTVSLIRSVLPSRFRLFVYLAINGALVTFVDLLMARYMPALSNRLGIYVPLIVVNCILLGRAEAVARRVPPGRAVLDALGSGIGFLLALALIALIREALGSGTITLVHIGSFSGVIRIPGLTDAPVRVVGYGVGALLVVGYLLALFNWIGARHDASAEPSRGIPEEVV